MPWQMKEENGKFCVYKKGETKAITCHDTKDQAKSHMRALYANVEASMSLKLSNLEAPSLSDRLQAITGAFHSMGQPDPNPYDCYIREVYDDYILVSDGKKVYKVGYSIDDQLQVIFDKPEDWKEQKLVDAIWGFEFTELQSVLGSFDGLAASHDVAFVSMSGEELFIEPEDLEAYITNGRAVIESTRTSSGDIVGLPIDLGGHDHKGGAGWIKDFELDRKRNIIRFIVEWTEAGANLIRNNLSRFFSPTVDPINKVILGGSMTNWPATRNSMGQLLLQPIELSMSMKGMNMATIEEITAQMEAMAARVAELEKPKAPATPSTPASPEDDSIGTELENLIQDDGALDQLGLAAQAKAKELARVAQRKSHVVEFVSKVVGGTPDHPVGLPIHARELTKLLLSLPEKQSLAVERLLGRIWDATLDFAEHGVAVGDVYSLRKPVPTAYASLLREWVSLGKSPQSFFEVNPEAGSAEEFNLTPFMKKEN